MSDQDRNGRLQEKLAQTVHSAQADKVSVEFEREDITEADKPYIRPLLEDSLLQWLDETANIPIIRDGSVFLFGHDGELVGSGGKPVAPADARMGAVRGMAAETIDDNRTDIILRQVDGREAAAVAIRTRTGGSIFAVLVIMVETSLSESAVLLGALHLQGCFYRRFEKVYIEDMMLCQRQTEREAKRRDALFLAAKRLYDQIEVSSVLTEMLRSLEELYPRAEVHLYLSQDHRHEDSRVKPLLFKNTSHDMVARAFLEGKSITEKEPGGSIRLAVPMAGKQAAYGVLCITAVPGCWDEADMPAFLLVADSAGTAFENARLYEQSNLLINELRLINELTKQLNQSLRLKQIFHFVTTEMLSIFGADYCCVLQLSKEKNLFNVMSSNIPSMSSEQFSPEYGFCGIVHRTKDPLIISDYWQTRVVHSKLMDNTGSRSLIATPIVVEDEVAGVILVTHKEANYFSYDNYKLLQVISSHIGLAVTNASLHAEVRRMVITDNLTGLHVRHYLNEQIHNRQQKDPHGSLILVDIDHFKQVNDTFGHQVGDRILIQVSEIIKASIRHGDIAARWGGEELAVYLPGIHSDQAYQIAERIRDRVREETSPLVTVSCGVSEWSYENEKISVESLFYRADMALYEAKNNGKNCIFIGQG